MNLVAFTYEQEVCPNGSYSLSNWAYCVDCPAGHGCVSVSSIPSKFPVGTVH